MQPVFDRSTARYPRVVRPSAYVIVAREDGAIITVLTPCGYHLPGGGIENGETAEEACVRETREETGLAIAVCKCIAEALEIVDDAKTERCLEKHCAFFVGQLTSTAADAAIDSDHQLHWLDPRAVDFSHDVHRWAVDKWLRSVRHSGY